MEKMGLLGHAGSGEGGALEFVLVATEPDANAHTRSQHVGTGGAFGPQLALVGGADARSF